jgi:hypothetical protein
MARDRFLIAPFSTGWQKNLKPWLIPDDAFVTINNAYVQYGRINKRVGSRYSGGGKLGSRLCLLVGMTDASGNINSGISPLPSLTFAVGQVFSIGTDVFTVVSMGLASMLSTSSTASTYTFNTTTGAYTINGSVSLTNVYFYPAQPVMGLTMYERGSIGEQVAFAFDQQSIYKFVNNQWLRETSGAVSFSGNNAQLFWTANWRGVNASDIVLFVSNFNIADQMRSYDGTTWSNFKPQYQVASTSVINTARIIVAFKNRLVLLNTVESLGASLNVPFVNRCRYSQNGSPLAANAFYEQNQVGAGGGGFIDAPTSEEIVTAEFLKDRLIVYCERSTWELAYTGNEILPFVWQKINTELGAQSPFASVPFDKAVLNVGDTGYHACNGFSVDRIDERIQKEIFTINTQNDGPVRTYGIRDYYEQLVYWSFPSEENLSFQVFPDKFFIYNYENKTWASNDDTFTAFGYFEQQMGDTWQNDTTMWQDNTSTWDEGLVQASARRVCAGNQQGFVVLINGELTANAANLQITNMSTASSKITLTVINHNLRPGMYIKIVGAQGVSGLVDIYQIQDAPDANTLIVNGSFTGTYKGGGNIGRISQIYIQSKEWNPYIDKGLNVAIDQIDFQVDRTAEGEVTIDYALSSASDLSMVNQSELSGSILGDNVLSTAPYPTSALEAQQDRLNHAVYFQGAGQFFQLQIYLSDAQLTNLAIAESEFMLHSLILYAQPAGQLRGW